MVADLIEGRARMVTKVVLYFHACLLRKHLLEHGEQAGVGYMHAMDSSYVLGLVHALQEILGVWT